MIRGHQITLELAQTPNLANLLNDLHGNQALRQEMKKDPRAYLESRGVNLPYGASVEERELDEDGWEIEMKVIEGAYTYINGFSTVKGFYRIQGPKLPRDLDRSSSSA